VLATIGKRLWGRAMRAGIVAGCIGLALLVSGCTSGQPGPRRAFLITDDVEWTKPLGAPDLATFYNQSADQQANIRNQVLTARMYMADLEYHYYEARLTKEMQEEGLAAGKPRSDHSSDIGACRGDEIYSVGDGHRGHRG
jgi:hypothetical protein